MQALVLHATWDAAAPADPKYLKQLTHRAAKVEEHISHLCMELKTARAVEDGNQGFDAWRKGQEAVAANLQARVGLGGPKAKQLLAEEAMNLEKEAELMVQELKANLQRGDTREFASWERLHTKELAALEQSLSEAKANGQPAHHLLLKIKACHQDMTKIRHVASESTAGSSSDSSDSEDDAEYEQVASLRCGDRVRLLGDDEDGFKRGECGVIAEVDTSIAYPYRLTKRGGADGWFKACDLELVESKQAVVRVIKVPLQIEANPCSSPCKPAQAGGGSGTETRAASASPYRHVDSPYSSECGSSGEEGYDACDLDPMVDLEKGSRSSSSRSFSKRASTPTLQAFLQTVTKDVACTLNPLAAGAVSC